MPRNPRHSNTHDATFKQLRNLRLGVQLRAEQVKLRRLEWDTQKLALPHITPLPGDSELQTRRALTEKDLPRQRPPVKMPEFKPGMSHEGYQFLIELYMDDVKRETRRDPYNKLASITAQAILEAAQAREDARLEKEKEKEQVKARAKAKAEIDEATRKKNAERWRR